VKRLPLACACLFLVSGIVAAQSYPVPFINQPLVPASAAPGSGAFTLTVNGSGFAPTAVVSWNGSLRATTVFTSTHLQASILASDVAGLGTARVQVINLGSNNETSAIAYFPTRTPSPGVAFAQDPNFSTRGLPGDFNNDGKLDLVNVYAVNSTTMEADVYLSKGNVKFQAPIKTQFAGYEKLSATAVLVGDFNGDHNLDVLVSLSQGSINYEFPIVLLGDGTGKFSLVGSRNSFHPHSSVQYYFYPLFSADIDGDGNLDVVAINYDGYHTQVVVLYGDGKGGFSVTEIPGSGSRPDDVITGDFNEDGQLDLAVLNDSSSVIVLLSKGNRTFQKGPARYTVSPAYYLLTADVNGDNHLDIVTDSGSVLLGNSKGKFTHGVSLGTAGFDITAGDFNGDGKLDLVEGSISQLGLSVFLGNGDGTFQSPIETNGLLLGALCDYNHDGRLDFVASGEYLWQVPANLYPAQLGFGEVPVGTTSAPLTATLSNANGQELTGIKIGIGGANANEFAETNNCPSSLPVRSSCQIQVTFSPTSLGYQSASLNVAYDGLGSPQSVGLGGSGEQGTTVSLLPSSLTFATQNLKTTSTPQTATLTNTGSTDVTISNISTSAQFGQSNNCPATLSVGQSCQIQVTFGPTAVGQANGTLSVTDNASGSPQTVALSGVGTLITLSPIGINFGNQKVGTSSSPVPVTLSNQGTITLSISQIEIGGADPSDFSQTNNCGTTLAAGAQCTIQVTFTPTQTGARSAEIQVQDDVNPSPQDVALGGTGT
jgi:hypothetical protein